jgi:mono/diheme cytochrome c family protein
MMKKYLMLASGLFVLARRVRLPLRRPATGIAPQQQNAAQTNAPQGNAANGRKLFVSFGCYQCHGYEAQGGSAGARLAPRPIAYAQLLKYVRHPTGEMPPFTEEDWSKDADS